MKFTTNSALRPAFIALDEYMRTFEANEAPTFMVETGCWERSLSEGYEVIVNASDEPRGSSRGIMPEYLIRVYKSGALQCEFSPVGDYAAIVPEFTESKCKRLFVEEIFLNSIESINRAKVA